MIEVSYFGWHIHSETHDLCDETSCPVAVGDFLVAHSQVLPGYTPPVSLLSVLYLFLLRSFDALCPDLALDLWDILYQADSLG